MEAIQMYKEVLNGGSWERGFFSPAVRNRRITEIMRYVFETKGITAYEQAVRELTEQFIKQ